MFKATGPRKRVGKNHVGREMARAEAAMMPYIDRMQEGDGLRAMLIVTGMAQFVEQGLESEATLKDAIRRASDLSGIPVSALSAHVSALRLMLRRELPR
jgi:hypothetical protein